MQIDMFAAMSIDGRIGLHKYHGNDWTSREDRDFLFEKIAKYDWILVGETTHQAAIQALSKYRCMVFTRDEELLASSTSSIQYCNPEFGDFTKFIEAQPEVRIAVLGGAETYSYFFTQHLFSRLYITVEPLLFGEGVPLCREVDPSQKIHLEEVRRLNEKGSVLLVYKMGE